MKDKFKVGEVVRLSSNRFSWGGESKISRKKIFGRITKRCAGDLYQIYVLNGNESSGRKWINGGWNYFEDEIYKLTPREEDEAMAWVI